jgi:Zn-dependent protease
MTVLLPLLTFYGSGGSFMFGGAKPVPVVPRNYRNYKRGDIIVSLAGITTNLILAVVCTALIVLLGLLGRGAPTAVTTLSILQRMMEFGIFFNLILAVFNLLPIPPLDGSHVVKYLLPPTWALRYQQVGRFGIVILILLIATRFGQPILSAWLKPVNVLLALSSAVYRPFMLESSFFRGF